MSVPHENVAEYLEKIYVKNLEAAITNIERKERQSEMQRKRNAEQANLPAAPATSSGQPDAASSSAAEPTSAAVPEPKTPPKAPPRAPPQRSGQPAAARDQSWSWNRDHYGSRREWTRWQGAWYYRDDARSRWIYWGR